MYNTCGNTECHYLPPNISNIFCISELKKRMEKKRGDTLYTCVVLILLKFSKLRTIFR